ncbi:MAG: rubrerythrin family protein [Candidatus Loosdrechtia sp.]|uniref:rubrerythrin family protein n=1 Tax=Candidatus Loosdrechtia sp. TaxID=3101272 RepID=UPI003A653881|nr:MAG: rubrerythrin family protein [Candidatus Jettenia sp. AMX2]
MTTKDNLKSAFEGESWAHRKYLAFAKRAEEEGFKQEAKLFRAMAESEAAHANYHLRILGDIMNTRENIIYARDLETQVTTKMYPQMIEEAEKEGNKEASQSFRHIKDVEKGHVNLCQKVLDNLGKNKNADYFVCQVCGNILEESLPDKCHICTTEATFIRIS